MVPPSQTHAPVRTTLLNIVNGDILYIVRDSGQSVLDLRSCPTLDMPGNLTPESCSLHCLAPTSIQIHGTLILAWFEGTRLLVYIEVKP